MADEACQLKSEKVNSMKVFFTTTYKSYSGEVKS